MIEPTARPVLLESMRGQILAIDASIWIYHFIKAMRDGKGQLLRAAHLVGFFRRICKLLFYEIKPVFVFDGAAPILKKSTTKRRQQRRQDCEETARATANRLLTLQLQRMAENSKESQVPVKGSIPQNAHYLDGESSKGITPKGFQSLDTYHLPEIESIMPIQVNDSRLLTEEELNEYASKFTEEARAGFIDTATIDFKSPEFASLPLATQYQLVNTARLKSRLRMGYSAEQLDAMFPDSMDFSRFQIKRVAQRNALTQKLMGLGGLEEDLTRRVSSEKNKHYMLKRNEKGWTLSLENADSTAQSESLEHRGQNVKREEHSDSDEFEDVDLEPEPNEPQRESLATSSEERSPDFEKLFGFEAAVQREKLFPVEFSEPKHPSSAQHAFGHTGSTKSGPVSFLFSNQAPQTKQDSDPAKKKDVEEPPPWFASSDSKFESMALTDRTEGSLVPIELADSIRREYDEYRSSKRPKVEPERNQETETNTIPAEDTTQQYLNTFDARERHNDSCKEREPERKQEPETNTIPAQDTTQQHFSTSDARERDNGSYKEWEPVNIAGAIDTEPQQSELENESVAPKDLTPPGPVEVLDLTEDSPNHSEPVEQAETIEPQRVEPEFESAMTPTTADEEHTEEYGNKVLTEEDIMLAEADALAEEDEDQDLADMMIGEVEETERFNKALNIVADRAAYQTEITTLKQQFANQQRDADTVTDEMVSECQELLQLFGIPYITAPMEAEAQCAELQTLGLVDGIVTDDGDSFLFGEVLVYRNMFSMAKYVESYSSDQINEQLGLDRSRLIGLAFLLGSDYTDGILGIGPVIGVELLAEFGSLEHFRDWWSVAQRSPTDENLSSPFKRKFYKRFKSKLFLPENFPEAAVTEAYEHPVVDPDDTKFEWAPLDIAALKAFFERHAGWSPEYTNDLLVPVVEETKRRQLVNKGRKDQSSLDKWIVEKEHTRSKRAHRATDLLKRKR